MKLSIKNLKLIEKWYDLASSNDDLEEADLVLYDKIREYLDENDPDICDSDEGDDDHNITDINEDDEDDNEDLFDDFNNISSRKNYGSKRDPYAIYDIDSLEDEDY